jgi:hypothetical protein
MNASPETMQRATRSTRSAASTDGRRRAVRRDRARARLGKLPWHATYEHLWEIASVHVGMLVGI